MRNASKKYVVAAAALLLCLPWLGTRGATAKRRTVTRTRTVAPESSGELAFTDDFGLTTNLDFVIVDQLEQVHSIQTDASTVTTGIARRE